VLDHSGAGCQVAWASTFIVVHRLQTASRRQIENKYPAGKEQVWRGQVRCTRIRIDRYFVGLDSNDPQIASSSPSRAVQASLRERWSTNAIQPEHPLPEPANDMRLQTAGPVVRQALLREQLFPARSAASILSNYHRAAADLRRRAAQ
jgi:hypothetical protein